MNIFRNRGFARLTLLAVMGASGCLFSEALRSQVAEGPRIADVGVYGTGGQAILLRHDAAADGERFRSFGTALAEGAGGAIAFWADTLSIGGTVRDGIVYAHEDGSSMDWVARVGDRAPGADSGRYAAFGTEPQMDADGRLAFFAFLEGGEATSGLFVVDGASTRVVALAGLAGEPFQALGSTPVLGPDGVVGFTAYLANGAHAVVRSAGGQTRVVAREGEPSPDGSGRYLGFDPALEFGSDGELIFRAETERSGGRETRFAHAGGRTRVLAGTAAENEGGGLASL
jgi:hypothetical protein